MIKLQRDLHFCPPPYEMFLSLSQFAASTVRTSYCGTPVCRSMRVAASLRVIPMHTVVLASLSATIHLMSCAIVVSPDLQLTLSTLPSLYPVRSGWYAKESDGHERQARHGTTSSETVRPRMSVSAIEAARISYIINELPVWER